MSDLLSIAKPEDAKLDVVFIHGLGGDPISTWQHGDSEEKGTWPHWLAAKMPAIGVHTLSYAASPHHWLGPSMPLGETAENLLGVLVASKEIGTRPLVLVGHSMGGLVIKQILRTVSDRKDVKPWQPIGKAVKAVMFLGTPHRGAQLATYLERIGRYFETSSATADLRRHGEVLIGLNDWYAANARDRGIATHCFYETEPTPVPRLPNKLMIVEKDSGDIDIADIPSCPVPVDHIQICKPSTEGDFRVGYLMRIVEDVLAPASDGSETDTPPPVDTLPTAQGDFIGRVQDLAIIREALLAGNAAVTAVEGMGGIGKTVTSLQVAKKLRDENKFPDSVLFVDLHGFSEGREPLSVADGLTSLLRQLLGSEEDLPTETDQLQQAWRQVTAGKRMLLLLDNARDEAQIKPLLPGHDTFRVLTTSRNRFVLPGLKLIELGLLTEDEAIDLAMRRANQHWQRLNPEQAKRLAAGCGRHPLAIEVTASALGNARVLNVDEQIEKLGNPEKTALKMEEVKVVLRLSLGLLEQDEHAAWCRLGVFEGDFDVEAAKAVMDVDNADDILATLEIHNLVTWQDNGRLQLHDILRAIALEDLNPVEHEAAGERHSRHYLGVMWACDRLYKQKGQMIEGLSLYDREQRQIQAGQTFAAARVESAADFAQLAADYANAGAYVLYLRLTPRTFIAWLETQAEACRKLGDRLGEGVAFANMGIAYRYLGELRRSIEYSEQHLEIAREIGDRQGEGSVLGNMGSTYEVLGESRRAIEYYEQHLEIAREIGDQRGEGNALGNMGNAYADLGESRRAMEYYEQHLEIAREIGDQRGEGNALFNAADDWKTLGDHAKAIDSVQQALSIYEAIEDPNADRARALLAKLTAEAEHGSDV